MKLINPLQLVGVLLCCLLLSNYSQAEPAKGPIAPDNELAINGGCLIVAADDLTIECDEAIPPPYHTLVGDCSGTSVDVVTSFEDGPCGISYFVFRT